MPTPTVTKVFIDAECLAPECQQHKLGFVEKRYAKQHVEDTGHSVVVREHATTIWRA